MGLEGGFDRGGTDGDELLGEFRLGLIAFADLGEGIFDNGALVIFKAAAEEELGEVVEAVVEGFRSLDGIGGEVAGGLDELGVVEGDEGLERGVGEVTPDAEDLAGGGVEDFHGGMGGGALPEGVEGAAVELVAGVLLVEASVGLVHGDGLPDSFGLVGFDGWSAGGGDEKT